MSELVIRPLSAVHLYEQAGFAHVDPEALHMPYARANVFTALRLG